MNTFSSKTKFSEILEKSLFTLFYISSAFPSHCSCWCHFFKWCKMFSQRSASANFIGTRAVNSVSGTFTFAMSCDARQWNMPNIYERWFLLLGRHTFHSLLFTTTAFTTTSTTIIVLWIWVNVSGTSGVQLRTSPKMTNQLRSVCNRSLVEVAAYEKGWKRNTFYQMQSRTV